MIISGSVLPRMINVADKSCGENKTHVLCSVTFFSENRAVYERMWENMVERGRPEIAIRYGACAFYAGELRLRTQTQNI